MIGYLSGPITGHPNYRQEFGDAADELRALGYHIINPAEICQVIPTDQLGYEAIMQIDLVLLEKADYTGPVTLEYEKLWHPYLPELRVALEAVNRVWR